MLRVLIVLLSLVSACGLEPDRPTHTPSEPPGVPRVRILVSEHPEDPESAPSGADDARYGDPLHIVADGLEPGARVVLEAASGAGTARAAFIVGADGAIDVARAAPESGSYSGVEPEGLLWSMADPPVGPLDLTVTVRALADDDTELARDVLVRRYVDDGLILDDIVDGTLVGTLALPDPARFGPGPYAAVLCFGGSEGGAGAGVFRAMYLASLGVAAFGVAYFGETGVPAELTEVPLEILEGDLAFLASHPSVDPERIGVMGGSRGGELALLLGAHFPIVKAVVAAAPSGFVWGSVQSEAVSAWTRNGVPLPFVPSSGALPEVVVDGEGEHWSTTPMFLADIAAASPEALAAATIPIEAIDGSVLLLGGDDDQLWPSCAMSAVAWDRLAARGHGPADAFLCMEGAGHSIGIPGWSTLDVGEAFHAQLGAWLVLGGTPAATARAQRAADTALRVFLRDAL